MTLRNRPVTECSVLIGWNEDFVLLAKVCINQFNRLIRQDLVVHVLEDVFEDGARHVQVQVVSWYDTDFNWVWKQNFLSVVELCNHVVGSWKKTGLVE